MRSEVVELSVNEYDTARGYVEYRAKAKRSVATQSTVVSLHLARWNEQRFHVERRVSTETYLARAFVWCTEVSMSVVFQLFNLFAEGALLDMWSIELPRKISIMSTNPVAFFVL
ncbi:hypothetical protein [Pyrobaculum sp.]|uniref:hypothetical protein n=1 Tax=Pyrobaculum sp. TaxID=2004705 RepID=UPI003D0D713D